MQTSVPGPKAKYEQEKELREDTPSRPSKMRRAGDLVPAASLRNPTVVLTKHLLIPGEGREASRDQPTHECLYTCG